MYSTAERSCGWRRPTGYWRTFYAPDKRKAFVGRQWKEGLFDHAVPCDIARGRALMLASEGFYVREHACEVALEWIREGALMWERSPPDWYTPLWVEQLLPVFAGGLVEALASLDGEAVAPDVHAAPKSKSSRMEPSAHEGPQLGPRRNSHDDRHSSVSLRTDNLRQLPQTRHSARKDAAPGPTQFRIQRVPLPPMVRALECVGSFSSAEKLDRHAGKLMTYSRAEWLQDRLGQDAANSKRQSYHEDRSSSMSRSPTRDKPPSTRRKKEELLLRKLTKKELPRSRPDPSVRLKPRASDLVTCVYI